MMPAGGNGLMNESVNFAVERPGAPVLEPGHVWLAGAGPGDPGLLTLDCLAGLTQAEARVLEALCEGATPTEVAASLGVAVSTVRTQLATIRAKTGAAGIRQLVAGVANLPPVVCAVECR